MKWLKYWDAEGGEHEADVLPGSCQSVIPACRQRVFVHPLAAQHPLWRRSITVDTNRRVGIRHSTMGLLSGIYNGKSRCIGVVEDVSDFGIRVSQIPLHFDDHAGQCFSIVYGPQYDYNLALQPCWKIETSNGMYKMIGFRMENTPPSWKDFVTDCRCPSDLFHPMFALNEKADVTCH